MAIRVLRYDAPDFLSSGSCAFSDETINAYRRNCSELWDGLNEVGCVVLEVRDGDILFAATNALGASSRFFDKNQFDKQQLSCGIPSEGYARRSGKELLAFRLGAPQLAASLEGKPQLEAACACLDRLGRAVLRDLCRSTALGLHPAGLGGLLEDEGGPLLRGQPSASALRASKYEAGPSPSALAFAPHHDRGALTLVASTQAQGLQVAGPGGAWLDVPLGPGRVAVLCRYSLSYALGGLLRPVLHRPPTLCIHLLDGPGPRCLEVRLQRTAALGTAMESCARMWHLRLEDLVFVYRGRCLSDRETAEQLGMRERDRVHVHARRAHGGR
ncbi:hypothetical protein HYH03_009220 [Edaphochlamys debaryana]|uniref:Ubiquitin-like domain-containing protein n=1 Tax=Edaphochlamys debaryana TaxID=47281 RepID=A0A835XYG3_9CHLO|nr:hypothetical protein HYH03_009220 [Edaphochlamys debaryana]|eukprot:KAG2492558.1 hypothetical protein HYH03_009220 [Edaphochlamys debaryana]